MRGAEEKSRRDEGYSHESADGIGGTSARQHAWIHGIEHRLMRQFPGDLDLQ